MSEETIIFNLELNVENAFSSVRKIELILFRALGLWQRFCKLLGLPPDSPINVIAQKAQQIVMIARTIHTAAVLIESASGPLGWIMAALSVGSAAVQVADMASAPMDAMLSVGE